MKALSQGGVFQFEGFRLDRQSRVLFRRDEAGAFVPIAVGSRALDVLDVLLDRAGNLVLRDAFMAAVWPATAVEDINLNMQVAALRRVLDEGRAEGSCIQTIPGRGYRFAVPVARVEPSTPSASGLRSGNGAGGLSPSNRKIHRHRAGLEISHQPSFRRSTNGSGAGSLGLVVGVFASLVPWSPPRIGTGLNLRKPTRHRVCRSSCCRSPSSATIATPTI